MNRFGTDTKINAKMGNILLKSNVIKNKENEWIGQLLENKQEPILKYDEIEILEKEKREFLNSSLFMEFYKTACKEWEMIELIDDDKQLECSLCGQKDTKKKYYIKNKLNGTTLNVGSTCINNFDDIKGINGKTKEEIEKEWKIQNRDKLLNKKYPGIIGKMDQWGKKIEEIPTIIKGELEKEYFSIDKEAVELREKFRKKKTVDNIIANKINDLVNQGEEVLQKIYQDIEKNKENEWYITKEIKEWCYTNNKDKILEIFLKEDGIVTWRSACRIHESNLVEKIINKLKEEFKYSKISIKGFDNKRNGIIININERNSDNNRIDLICPYNQFMGEYGGIIFKQTSGFQNEKEFVIKHSKIIDNSSLNISIRMLKYLLKKYSLNINNWDLEYNEMTIKEYSKTKEIMYNVLNLKQFVNEFLNFIFKENLTEDELNRIITYIKNNSSVMTDKEYKERTEERIKNEKAMQVDYNKFI